MNEKISKSYSSLEKMEDEWEKERKEHPIKDFFHTIWCKLELWFWDNPNDLIRKIKWFIQRGRRGYSDRDCWDIHHWLSDILPGALKQMKNNKLGLPCDMFLKSDPVNKHGDHTKVAFKKAEKRWDKIINSIIYTFEVNGKILNDNWLYCKSESYHKKENKDLRKRMSNLDFMYIMTLKECKAYEKGWENFRDHFFSLWD